MSINTIYEQQVNLLLDILPIVTKETCFALKGGTGINLFVRDMPRLSVDIDLTYLPTKSRDEALKEITAALINIARNIELLIPKSTAVKIFTAKDKRLNKLLIKTAGAQIKIEPNEILRGTVFSPIKVRLCENAKQYFKKDVVNVPLLSLADLYGGKICAALDRQHPRDLFDIKLLFENEGITAEVRQAFVVYLACHSRPIHELLKPNILDIRATFEKEFLGMSRAPVTLANLLEAREKLVSSINNGLTEKERYFLISVKKGEPQRDLLPGLNINNLPALKWKVMNTQKMDKKKRQEMLDKLTLILKI